jgi:predicted transposase YdaD
VRRPYALRAKTEVVLRSIPPARFPDHLYQCGSDLTQLEFCKQYHGKEVPRQMLDQRGAMSLVYPDVVVHQFLILMSKADAPAVVPEFYQLNLPKYRPLIEFTVVRLWEMDPERAFALEHPSLLPWVLAMNASQAQMMEAFRRMEASGRAKELVQRATTLAPLRLDKAGMDEIIRKAGSKRMTYREVVQDTWLYHEIFDEGVEKGIEKGIEKGAVQALRDSIRRITAKRFPALGTLPGLDAASPEELQKCLDDVALAGSDADLRAALGKYLAS